MINPRATVFFYDSDTRLQRQHSWPERELRTGIGHARNFNATFVVVESEGNYTVQRTPSMFLMGPDGGVIDVFAMTAAPDTIAAAMK